MNTEELKNKLNYLVDKYIQDSALKSELKAIIQREDIPPVKGIMADIQSKGTRVEALDSDLIKEIAFYFM